jgi:hypothetical protein
MDSYDPEKARDILLETIDTLKNLIDSKRDLDKQIPFTQNDKWINIFF